ncbi:MAG: flagellar FlbD family protein, partial [Acidimicrobiales bacterium]
MRTLKIGAALADSSSGDARSARQNGQEDEMITLHNVQGHPVAINGSLIERVDGGPETHVLLVSGTSYIVTESIEDVVRLHREDRAAVQALADSMPHDLVSAGP